MPTAIASTLYPKLLSAIQETEPDIDQIDDARFQDDGSIIALASAGDVQFAVKIDDSCEVKLIDSGVQFAAPKKKLSQVISDEMNKPLSKIAPVSSGSSPPKKKNCIKGISCGNSCISSSKVCEKLLGPEEKALFNRMKKHASSADANSFDKRMYSEARKDILDAQKGIIEKAEEYVSSLTRSEERRVGKEC